MILTARDTTRKGTWAIECIWAVECIWAECIWAECIWAECIWAVECIWAIECIWALTRRASQKFDRDCIIVRSQLALRKAKGAMQLCAAVGHARAACDATEVLTQDLQ